ncbi:MAG: YggT family protein [Chloroflexota bacterium]
MTDYERTTTRETTVEPQVDAYGQPVAAAPPAAAMPPVAATSVRTTDRTYVAAGPGGATTAARVVTFLFGILQVLLILRIILLLLVANRSNDIVQFVLSITQPFVDPFLGMFSLNRVTADQGSVLDVAAIVALIGWTLIEALVLAAIRLFSRRATDTV